MARNKKKPTVKVTIKQPTNQRRTRRNRNRTRRGPTQIGRAIREVGSTIGGLVGMPGVGNSAGSFISRIFGQGDYITNNPKQNSLMGGVPAFSPLTSGFRIKHREYITDINSSVGFSLRSYRINPGLNELFPWLSQVANNFEDYKIHGMVVYLNTSSATAVSSTNTALGIWGVVTQYDPSEPDFTTKQQCENYVGAQSAVVANSLLHGIECAPQSNVLTKMYVRSSDNISDEEDLKFYDWGKIQIFTQGAQAASVIGEMWVSYDIEFSKPRMPTGGYLAYSDRYYLTGVANSLSLGSANTTGFAGNNIGTAITAATRKIQFPPGAPPGLYLVYMRWNMSVTTSPLVPPTFTLSTTNLSFKTLFDNDLASSSSAPTAGLTGNNYAVSAYWIYKADALLAEITVGTGQFFGTTSMDMVITLCSSGLFEQIGTFMLTKKDKRALKKLLYEMNKEVDDNGSPLLVKKKPVVESYEHV